MRRARRIPPGILPVRPGTGYIDLLQLHGFDARPPVEEVLSSLNLVRAGKLRCLGVSNSPAGT